MSELKFKKGQITLGESFVDYLIQWNGEGYLDLQVKRGRYTTNNDAYDFSYLLSDGGESIKACKKKFAGLLEMLCKEHPNIFGDKSIENSFASPKKEKIIVTGVNVSSKANNLGVRTGAKWSANEDELLIKRFHQNKDISELAKVHGRSEKGIEFRLIKLGLIKN